MRPLHPQRAARFIPALAGVPLQRCRGEQVYGFIRATAAAFPGQAQSAAALAGFDDSRLDVDMAARHLPSGHVHANNRMLAALQQPYPCPGSRAFVAPGPALFFTISSRRSCVTVLAQSGQNLTSWTVSSSSSW